MRTAEDSGTEFTIVEATGWDVAAGRTAARELFAELDTVTAVLASSFGLGVGTLRAAAELDLGIPRDASIIALHGGQLADYLNPRLTTVGLPVAEMAHRAVDTLIEVIDGANAQSSRIRIKPRVIERDSTSKRYDTGSAPAATTHALTPSAELAALGSWQRRPSSEV